MAARTQKKPAPRAAKSRRTRPLQKSKRASRKAQAPRKPARTNGGRKPKRTPRRKPNGGRRQAPVKRGAAGAAKAATMHARRAGVKPEGSPELASASGRMHAIPRRKSRTKELAAPKPRPAGLTRQQRKKATNEEAFGFKQIEERLSTTRGKTGIAAERRKSVPEFEDEVKEGGVEQANEGYVDYDKQERTAEEEPEVDIEAPAAQEEE
jgi:hypothetical protein